MNNLKIFENKEFGQVRVIEQQGQPWFALTDVCKILDIANSRDVKTRLREDGVVTTDIIDSLGRIQKANFINESNLYKVIFQSRKEEAEAFTEWVTSEVLPSVRKNGGYIANQENLTPEQIVAKALVVAQKIIDDNKPKIDYYDALVNRDLLTSFRDTAKQLGIAESRFIKWLVEKHYIFRDCNNKLKPYAQFVKELFDLKDWTRNGKTGNQCLITPKGKETFRKRLRKEGLVL